jgi:hypothetical protein
MSCGGSFTLVSGTSSTSSERTVGLNPLHLMSGEPIVMEELTMRLP